MTKIKVGVLGGTFDPVHNGHLLVAQKALELLKLSQVYLVTAKSPPHKASYLACAEHRHSLVEKAVQSTGVKELVASRLELDRPGTSFTVDTVRAIKQEIESRHEGSQCEVFLITSAEYLEQGKAGVHFLGDWEGADELFRLAHLVVTPRRQITVAIASEWAESLLARGARVTVLDLQSPPISSLLIKRRLKAGEPIADMVPAAVEAHIKQFSLYQGDLPDFD